MGSLVYLAVSTCSDIVFAVSTVAQFCQDPGLEHWEAVKHIYRYLLGTKKLALTFGEGKQGLEVSKASLMQMERVRNIDM